DDLVDHLVGTAGAGVDLDVGHLSVQRQSRLQQCSVGRPRVDPGQQRPRGRQAGPAHSLGHVDVEEHHRVAGQSVTCHLRRHGAATEREDPRVLTQPAVDGHFLHRAESGLAVGGEDVGDRPALFVLDVCVCIVEIDTEPRSQQPAHRALTRAGRADHHDRAFFRHVAHCSGRFQKSRSWAEYASTLRLDSASESPPNFSNAASARTSATIDSSTTPALGTAHTSERWWIATAGSPVVTSTVDRARGTVEIGFIATRTRNGSPLVMPPSSPPARLLRRVTPFGPVSASISSWASLPHRSAVVKPSPISTPFIACTPISAPASLASRRRSQCTWEPSPGGSP